MANGEQYIFTHINAVRYEPRETAPGQITEIEVRVDRVAVNNDLVGVLVDYIAKALREHVPLKFAPALSYQLTCVSMVHMAQIDGALRAFLAMTPQQPSRDPSQKPDEPWTDWAVHVLYGRMECARHAKSRFKA